MITLGLYSTEVYSAKRAGRAIGVWSQCKLITVNNLQEPATYFRIVYPVEPQEIVPKKRKESFFRHCTINMFNCTMQYSCVLRSVSTAGRMASTSSTYACVGTNNVASSIADRTKTENSLKRFRSTQWPAPCSVAQPNCYSDCTTTVDVMLWLSVYKNQAVHSPSISQFRSCQSMDSL